MENNIDDQFIFYKQMFPKLDDNVIRLVLEEVEVNNILNVFLDLTLELTQEETLSSLNFLEPPPLFESDVRSTNHNQSSVIVERPSDSNDNILEQDNSTAYQPPGLLSRLLRRNSNYNAVRYERDDNL